MVRARSCLYLLQAELDNGAAVAALRRFNDNLAALPADSWGASTSTAGLVHAVDCRAGCRQAARALTQGAVRRPPAPALFLFARHAVDRTRVPPARLPGAAAEAKLRPVMHELAYNLESFNPAFTAVLLKVQSTIGLTDYVRRDQVRGGGVCVWALLEPKEPGLGRRVTGGRRAVA